MTDAYWDCTACRWVGREPENVLPPGWRAVAAPAAPPPVPVPVQTASTQAVDARLAVSG